VAADYYVSHFKGFYGLTNKPLTDTIAGSASSNPIIAGQLLSTKNALDVSNPESQLNMTNIPHGKNS